MLISRVFFLLLHSLFNKIKSIPIFVRNNVEEPIDSINLAQFTSAVHRGMRKMNLQETYLLQGYAWFVFD